MIVAQPLTRSRSWTITFIEVPLGIEGAKRAASL